jgi:hypothetical protein
MTSLTWDQVIAWRLAQHHLLERADRSEMLAVVTQICGLHAQVLSAAELQLWTRVEGLTPADLPRALWQDRSTCCRPPTSRSTSPP